MKVSSELIHVFKQSVLDHFKMRPWDFEDLPNKEQSKLMAAYFEALAKKDRLEKVGELIYELEVRQYITRQEVIKDDWESKAKTFE